jgi:hypothetical protein
MIARSNVSLNGNGRSETFFATSSIWCWTTRWRTYIRISVKKLAHPNVFVRSMVCRWNFVDIVVALPYQAHVVALPQGFRLDGVRRRGWLMTSTSWREHGSMSTRVVAFLSSCTSLHLSPTLGSQLYSSTASLATPSHTRIL